MRYNFDEIISRRGTNSLNYDGWRSYLFPLEPNLDLSYSDEELIRLWVADMAFSSPPPVLDAIKARVDRQILGYTQVYDPRYMQVLQAWCARQYNWTIDPSAFLTAPGIVTALYRLVPLLTEPDEAIMITTPSYAPFKKAGDLSDRRVVQSALVDTDGYYTMDFKDMEAKITDPENRIRVFILCHPHNPTGRRWTKEELTKLGQLCLDNHVWIISDEVHADLLRGEARHRPLATLFPDSERIITCMAASKSFNLAGNMLSHIFIKHIPLRQAWRKLYNDYHSPLSVVASQAAYEHGADWLRQLNEYIDHNMAFVQQFLATHLPLAGFLIPEATYLAWIDLKAYRSQRGATERWTTFFAQEAGVLVEGGELFVANGEDYIRINVACPKSTLQIGLKRMTDALQRSSV